MNSLRRILITILVITALWSSPRDCSALSASERNLTQARLTDDKNIAILNDEERKIQTEEESPFVDRRRRLIPYMTYYVSNNYLNNPPPSSQSPLVSYQVRTTSQTIKRRYQYPIGIRNNINVPGGVNVLGPLNKNIINNKNGNQQYFLPPPIQREKFIPSVRYDPKDIDNEEYFTPVIRNGPKLNPDEYESQFYQRHNAQRPIVLVQTTEPTTISSINPERQKSKQYFTTIGPGTAINLTPKYGDILIRKEEEEETTLKSPIVSNGEYLPPTKFIQRPNLQKPLNLNQREREREEEEEEDRRNYFTEEYDPLRFARPHPQQLSESYRLSENPHFRHQYNPRPQKPSVSLNNIVKSLQLTNQLPEVLNADNIDESIKTLVEILSLLNNGRENELPLNTRQDLTQRVSLPPRYEDYNENNYNIVTEVPKILTNHQTKRPLEEIYKPIIIQDDIQEIRNPTPPYINHNGPYHVDVGNVVGSREYSSPVKIQTIEQSVKPNLIESTTIPNTYQITENIKDDEIQQKISSTTEEPALNYPQPDGTPSHTQNFPPTSIKYGATRGKPNIDYPAYAKIPKTKFSCGEQRYKGFFGDPDTGCQVWHYCDLNGGKSSFLCPNGTIFSQVALTCDWWFNVKCESTTQLYVLNERLYKYILPVMPKFPEDFSGPEVDRYLELKFKEMEAKLKEKKLKKQQEASKKVKTTSQIQNDTTAE